MYGYVDSNSIPSASTYLKALSIKPPLQPLFPYEVEQSTNYYSEKDNNYPVLM